MYIEFFLLTTYIRALLQFFNSKIRIITRPKNRWKRLMAIWKRFDRNRWVYNTQQQAHIYISIYLSAHFKNRQINERYIAGVYTFNWRHTIYVREFTVVGGGRKQLEIAYIGRESSRAQKPASLPSLQTPSLYTVSRTLVSTPPRLNKCSLSLSIYTLISPYKHILHIPVMYLTNVISGCTGTWPHRPSVHRCLSYT